MTGKARSDKGYTRKVEPEELLEAIEQVRPSFRGPPNVTAIHRACIERGLLERQQVAPNTFRRIVKKHELLKPETEADNKRRLAFAKAHANELWQADTMYGRLGTLLCHAPVRDGAAKGKIERFFRTVRVSLRLAPCPSTARCISETSNQVQLRSR